MRSQAPHRNRSVTYTRSTGPKHTQVPPQKAPVLTHVTINSYQYKPLHPRYEIVHLFLFCLNTIQGNMHKGNMIGALLVNGQ